MMAPCEFNAGLMDLLRRILLGESRRVQLFLAVPGD